MAKNKPTDPQPVVVTEVCSKCGLDWQRHGVNPTTDDCIRLLKTDLAARPIVWPVVQPVTVPVPQPYPYPVPWRPWISQPNTWTCQTDTIINQKTAIEATCNAVPISMGAKFDAAMERMLEQPKGSDG